MVFKTIGAGLRKLYKQADVALGGYLPGGQTPEEIKAAKTEPEIEQRGVPVFKASEKKAIKAPSEQEVEVPKGRAATDIEAETKLREQGFMTVQTGTDEHGFPLTQIIPIEGYKEYSAASEKADADLAIDILLKGFAATPSTIVAVNSFVKSYKGIPGKAGKVGKIGKTSTGIVKTTQINTKTITQTKSFTSKFFSKKALSIYAGWITAVGVGLYAQAESPEGISINVNKFLIPEAQRTGNWTAVDEALELAEEVSNISIWEKILLATPLGIVVGTLNKLKGNAAGVQILTKYKEDQKEKQALGQTEAQYWEKRNEEQAAQDKEAIDYYNDERRKFLEWEREAAITARNEDAAYWREQADLTRQKEADDRKAIADFWLAYRKEAQKIADNSRPSNLNFGLL